MDELSTERAHQCGENACVSSLFFHEELEGGAVVGIDAGELNAIDLTRDATFPRFSELEDREASDELGLKRNTLYFSRNGGQGPLTLGLEMTAPPNVA
ncbi:MAG: hypothetical protein ABIP39_03235 [Polyangiaceae bacterium]